MADDQDDSVSALLPHPNKKSAQKRNSAPVIEQLESLSAALLNLINSREYESPLLNHLSAAFITEFDGERVGSTRDEHIREMKAAVEQNPNLRTHIMNMSSSVNENKGFATVWATQRVTNYPDDVFERESIKMLIWERRSGQWICLKHVGLRGSGVMP